MVYAGFWARGMTSSNPYSLFFASIILSLYFYEHKSPLPLLILALTALVLIFMYIIKRSGKKNSDISLVNASGQKLSFQRKILHALSCNIPLIIALAASFIFLFYSQTAQKLMNQYDICQSSSYPDMIFGSTCYPPLSGVLTIQISLLFGAYFLHLLMVTPIAFTKEKTSLYDLIARTRVIHKSPHKHQSNIVKFITRLPKALFHFLIISAGIVFFINIPDEPLNAFAQKLDVQNDFMLENNAYVAWHGLQAPAHENMYSFGRKVVTGKITKIESPLELKGNRDNLCFTQKDFIQKKNCASLTEIKSLIHKNEVLVKRFREIWAYQNRGSINREEIYWSAYFKKTYILSSINDLLNAYWIALARSGNVDDALFQWKKSTEFFYEMMHGPSVTFDKLTFNMLYSTNLGSLPVILNADKADKADKSDISDITKLLKKDFFTNVRNTRAMFVSEYDLLKSTLHKWPNINVIIKPHATLSSFSLIAQDFINASTVPPDKITEHLTNLEKRNNAHLLSCSFPYYNCFGKYLLRDLQTDYNDIFYSGHRINLHQRALTLWINAKQYSVPSDNMEDFLNQAPESLQNDYTQAPFRWDEEKKAIIIMYPVPKDMPEKELEIYYKHL